MDQVPESQGRIRVVTGVMPAVASDPVVTMPARVRWRIISAIARYVTDANVATRYARLRLIKAGVALGYYPLRNVMAANQAIECTWGAGTDVGHSSSETRNLGPLPVGMLLNDEWDVGVYTSGKQAADQWTALTLLVEEWIEPLA